ncbi:MAG: hypothetical protein JWL96_3283 [Sphingomonas bacterium]|uniref:DUF1287 domain-containing protein n=1 Tax=Sphingomonas bacterium TaxID=1895847 RepID=UPI00261C854B|nr:DUF1287 domain-containing protein [Sphingomonas bacterium]MDB5711213.1 hypothetical protein [Sphingomonas bacterium]
MTMSMDRRAVLAGLGAACVLPGCAKAATPSAATRLIAAARRQVGVTLTYDSAYSKLAFPGGDVPRARGVCTDVLVRAYRDGLGQDLQLLVNRDMRAAFSAYPKRWGLKAPDRNIDHRRVPNLQTWFKRHGAQLSLPADHAGWQPGDILVCLIQGSIPHIGIVSDRRGPSGWLVIHNIGAGAREEDMLFAWPPGARYRWGV